MYRDYFPSPETSSIEEPIIDHQRKISIPINGSASDGDAGVEEEAAMDPSALADELGFVNGIPLLFNSHRRLDGLNAWDNGEAFVKNDENAPMLINLDLHWHQLAAVHAIVRICFSQEASPKRCTGVLICDEVGLGKTFQAATFIAFLADATIRQKADVGMPPVLGGDCVFLLGFFFSLPF